MSADPARRNNAVVQEGVSQHTLFSSGYGLTVSIWIGVDEPNDGAQFFVPGIGVEILEEPVTWWLIQYPELLIDGVGFISDRYVEIQHAY